jgi:hypothetical protein
MIKKYINGHTQNLRLILQGDFGKDPDDIFALLMAYRNVDCVIANLFDSRLRARLAKSVLRDLSNSTTLVYAGSNTGEGVIKVADYEFDYPNLVGEDKIIIDNNPYLTILQDSISSVLIINSAMTDLANFFMDSYDPKVHNIHLIVMQGGYEQNDSDYLSPNCAANNAYDHYSAQICFDFIQQHDLPFVIITKKIAYDNPIPASTYSLFNTTYDKKPVTQYLERVRLKSLQSMYKLATLPAGDINREGFPDDRDAEWFFENIAKKPLPTVIPTSEDIHKYIDSLVVYDIFTVMYACEYQPHNKFKHIRLKNRFCEAVAKRNINYIDSIIRNTSIALS